MVKHVWIAIILSGAAFALAAQEAQPVIIVHTQGKVSLAAEGQSAAQPVLPGAVVKHTGVLKLAAGASATVYCQGQFKTVKATKSAALSELCAGDSGKRSVNADYDFGEKLMAAVEMVAVAKRNGDGWSTAVGDPKKMGDGWGTAVGDPKKMGDGWGTAVGDPKKMGDGWGGKGARINLIMPFGKVKAGPTVFSWSKPAAPGPYRLAIIDESDQTIHGVTVRDTAITFDLAGLKLIPGNLYRWKVSTIGGESMQSDELSFGLGDPEERTRLLSNAGKTPLAGSTASPTLRAMIEAVALEKGEWFYDAAQQYKTMQAKSKDPIVRMMHAAFWMRYGFSRLAAKAVRG